MRSNRDDVRNIVRMAAKTAMEKAPLGTTTREYPERIADEVMKQLDVSVLSLPQYAVDMANPSTILNALAYRLSREEEEGKR